jgi:fructokinase
MICTDTGVSLVEGQNFLKKPGGAPTNVAAAIGALGGNVDLAAKVGKDPFGKLLIKTLESFDVSTTYVSQTKDAFTTLAFVSLMDNGERDFVFNRGADGLLSKKDIGDIPLNEFEIIHFGSATAFLPGQLKESYDSLLGSALRTGKFVSFDPNYRQLLFQNDNTTFIENSWIYMTSADFFKVSDEEALLLTSTNNLEDAIKKLMAETTAVFAVTIGPDGTILRVGKDLSTVPSIAIQPIDTTGAGDAFVGSVLYQLSQVQPQKIKSLNAESWRVIVSNANKAGAHTCEQYGAMEAFKNLKNIE